MATAATTTKLPKQILVLENPDKVNNEKWYPGRSWADPPHPFRWILAGPPNSGKSNVIMNVMLRSGESKQPFQRLVLIHGAGPHSKEYDSLIIEHRLDEIPKPEFFMELQEQEPLKSVVILDDVDLHDLNKESKQNLSALFRFVSSHFGWSIFCSFQTFTDIDMVARKCSNLFTIWKPRSRHEIPILGNRLGVTGNKLEEAMTTFLPNRWDNLTFDFTVDTPAPIRKNLFEEIVI